MKLSVVLILLLLALPLAAACSSAEQTNEISPLSVAPEESDTGITSPPPESQFIRMFELVPYSFLSEHDIWFGNPGQARQIYGYSSIDSLEKFNNLSQDQRRQMAADLRGIIQSGWRWPDLLPLTGYDEMKVDSLILSGSPPPWRFSISEGDIDTSVIEQKLMELGYEKKTYGSNSYFSHFDDFQLELSDPVSSLEMADLNRVALLENKMIAAPATGILTAILDTLAYHSDTVIDNAACRALAVSLGDVVSGGYIAPERIIDPAPGHSHNLPLFDFLIPEDWGLLHRYEMVGTGYKDDGRERSWVLSLYYTNGTDASADAAKLAKRMASYEFHTQYKDSKSSAREIEILSDLFDVGSPMVRSFGNAATLTVECRYKPETPGSAWLGPTYTLRDLLFLAPDPAPYVKRE